MRSAGQAVMTALLVLKENVTDKTVPYLQLEALNASHSCFFARVPALWLLAPSDA